MNKTILSLIPGGEAVVRKIIMKKFILFAALFLTTPIALADDMDRFVGTWMAYDQPALTIKNNNGSLEIIVGIEPPADQKVTFENIKVEKDKLTFERVAKSKDGRPSPLYNILYAELESTQEGSGHFRLGTTPDMKDAEDTLVYKSGFDGERKANPTPAKASPRPAQGLAERAAASPGISGQPNIMEIVLFLNANQANNGSASFKADPDKKILEYFDADGRLMEKSYIDEHNDIVTQKFDKEGKVISETKLTEADIRSMLK